MGGGRLPLPGGHTEDDLIAALEGSGGWEAVMKRLQRHEDSLLEQLEICEASNAVERVSLLDQWLAVRVARKLLEAQPEAARQRRKHGSQRSDAG
jgi:hypothetical protein